MPMGQAGKFLRRVGAADGHTAGGYAHWCPACEEMHAFAVDKPFSNGAKWTFDGNLDAPTFSPSMLIRTGPRPMVPLGRPDAAARGALNNPIVGLLRWVGPPVP